MVFITDSEEASSNDGLNCPVVWVPGVDTYAPTATPSIEPTAGSCPYDDVCWDDAVVDEWDCAAYNMPIQVYRESDDDPYKATALDLDTGSYPPPSGNPKERRSPFELILADACSS